jgi:hypothetical protein
MARTSGNGVLGVPRSIPTEKSRQKKVYGGVADLPKNDDWKWATDNR